MREAADPEKRHYKNAFILLSQLILTTGTLGIVIRMKGVSAGFRLALAVILFGNAMICLAALCLWMAIRLKKKSTMVCSGEDILIVAPHQDDCVAIAGGYAIQTRMQGGRVTVLYATDGPAHDKRTRKWEALEAWTQLGIRRDGIHFLKHHMSTGFTSAEEIRTGIGEFAAFIEQCNPDIVFIPLYEGGHYQHDAVNYMVHQAVRRIGFQGKVYESPEYNFYLSFKTTPEKILSGLTRFIPFIRYDYPPEPIRDDEVMHLRMTHEQIEMKKRMLSKFTSQNPEQLAVRFGFEDRYQKLHDYDYRKPPFDYERSVARFLNGLKSVPLLGRPVSGMFKWTKTIHPDPGVVMTQIPI
jgi:LmbE family N-acetylglucosaminyl deacetylase